MASLVRTSLQRSQRVGEGKTLEANVVAARQVTVIAHNALNALELATTLLYGSHAIPAIGAASKENGQ
jgi:hypothetical protein